MLYLLVGTIPDGNCSTPRLELLQTLTDPTMEIFPRCRHDFPTRDQSAVLADKEKPRLAGAFLHQKSLSL
jgi:hypothetical protein